MWFAPLLTMWAKRFYKHKKNSTCKQMFAVLFLFLTFMANVVKAFLIKPSIGAYLRKPRFLMIAR